MIALNINDYRKQIDRIDNEMVKLFAERMEVAKNIANYKMENGLPVMDPARERAKKLEVMDMAPEELRDYTSLLYTLLFEVSRSHQNKMMAGESTLLENIDKALASTSQVFPETATVACQGIEGANSQQACDKLFRNPNILYFSTFEAVFAAVEKGLCQYAVIPVENSTAGSVHSVYDLMMSHNFHIVRSTRIKIEHCLMAKPGTKLSEIKEVFSHEQALSQCSGYLDNLGEVNVTSYANTAMAAKMVAESDRNDIAAICSKVCANYYGLEILDDSIQDNDNNYTRFICISKNIEIYPGADRTSLMLVTHHEPGSLYKVIAQIYALNINMLKLESRPIPGKDFDFMFYFDLETPVYSEQFRRLISELPQACESFNYLGSYIEKA